MLNRRLRHTKRYQEILNAFLKNGFSHFLYRIGLTERVSRQEGPEAAEDTNMRDIGIKLRRTLQQLGPAFIKLGQMASSRRDFVPEEIARELEKLQDEVEPISFETVRQIIEQELGDTLDVCFAAFDEKPLATASIGQVHLARLHSGETVAVKVQRPHVQPVIETDLEILHNLAGMVEARIEWARTYRLRDRLDEFADSLRKELDYQIEGRNCERIAKQFQDDPAIHIPEIYGEFSSKKVLTMEKISGIKVTDTAKLDAGGYDRKLIAKRIADSMFEQVLNAGFFHGDPHPGNLFIMPGNVVSYIDFGMVGHMGENMRVHFAALLMDVRKGDAKGVIRTFAKMGILDEAVNTDALERDLDDLIATYYDVPLAQLSLGNVIAEIFTIAYRNQVEIPTDITVLGKAILTVEGIINKLDPAFSIMEAVEPFGERLVRERYRPDKLAKQAWERLSEDAEIIAGLPRDLKELTGMAKKGKLRLDINVSDLHTFLLRMDKISNRLSFSIILLSFSILMVGLIIGAAISGQTTMLWKLPVIEIGSVIATLMFLFMVYTIFRSGRM